MFSTILVAQTNNFCCNRQGQSDGSFLYIFLHVASRINNPNN